MQDSVKKFSPAVFGIVLICFFLPWVNFTCAGQNYATLSGFELVTGTTVTQQGQNQKVDSEGLAVLVLISTLAGLYVSFLKSKESTLGASVIALIGTVVIFWLKSKIATDVSSKSQGMGQAEFLASFWIATICLLVAIGLNGYLYLQSTKQSPTASTQS